MCLVGREGVEVLRRVPEPDPAPLALVVADRVLLCVLLARLDLLQKEFSLA